MWRGGFATAEEAREARGVYIVGTGGVPENRRFLGCDCALDCPQFNTYCRDRRPRLSAWRGGVYIVGRGLAPAVVSFIVAKTFPLQNTGDS